MKNNVMKIKHWLFAVVCFVTLAGFSTTFGAYRHTVSNLTGHPVQVTIEFASCKDTTVRIPAGNAFSEHNACLVKKVGATVLKNWTAPSMSQGVASWVASIKSNALNNVAARPYVFGESPRTEAEKGAAWGAGAGAVAGGLVGLEGGPVGAAAGFLGGAGAGATYGAIGGAIKGSGLGGSHTWYVTGSDDAGYQVELQ